MADPMNETTTTEKLLVSLLEIMKDIKYEMKDMKQEMKETRKSNERLEKILYSMSRPVDVGYGSRSVSRAIYTKSIS